LQEAVGGVPVGVSDVAVGIATQRSTVVCWDRETGEALSPVISWQDRRNAAWLDELALDPADVHRITGLVPSPHYGAAKLRWCLDHLPAVARAQAAGRLCLGPLSSYLLFSLLEERPFVVDPSNASRTLLWDVETGDWSPVMLGWFGIPARCLPRCVSSRWAYGTLEVAGWPAAVEVCTGDQAAALFAQGPPRPDSLYVNIGTGAFIQRPADGTPPPAPGLLRSVAWRDDAGTLQVLEGTVNGAGSALDWLAERVGRPVEELLGRAGDWLDEVEDPPLFINGVGGLGAPYWKPGCPVRFDGQGGVAASTVSVIESIAFLIQVNFEAMAAALGPAGRVVVTGGLARLDGLCGRLAELSGLPVERPAQLQATSTGLARLMSSRIDTDAGPSDVFKPPGPGRIRERYVRWRRAMEAAIGRQPGSGAQ
jgi:glycerol kinase